MKRSILTTSILLAMISYASAQHDFGDNYKVVSLGAGFGTPYLGKYYSSSIPFNPTLSIEKGFLDGVSAGTTISYNSSKWNPNPNYKVTSIYLAGRAAYHFGTPNEKVDLYAGGSLGYAILFWSVKGGGAVGAGSGVAYSIFGGSRYYFTKKTAVYAELGYGSFSVANVGISIRAK